AAERILQAIGVIDALDLAVAAHAGVERRQLRRPFPGVGGDLHDAAAHHVGIDHAAPAAVVAARARDDGLPRARGHARGLVDRAPGHGGRRRPFCLTAGMPCAEKRSSCSRITACGVPTTCPTLTTSRPGYLS